MRSLQAGLGSGTRHEKNGRAGSEPLQAEQPHVRRSPELIPGPAMGLKGTSALEAVLPWATHGEAVLQLERHSLPCHYSAKFLNLMIKHVSVIYWVSKWRCLCQQQSGAEAWREAHIRINETYKKQSVIYELMEKCPHVLIKL